MKQYKKLTPEQETMFKELYLQDYSASCIFKALGQNYDGKAWLASSRMIRLRNKLKLPKRGSGHYPKFRSTYVNPETLANRQYNAELKLRERKEMILRMIPIYENQIARWKKELASVCVDSSKKEK